MKKLLLLFLVSLMSLVSKANGVVIVDGTNETYLRMTQSQIDVIVQNQIANIVSSQKFINDFGSSQIIKYAFPVPVQASVTQLRWRINGGDWVIAEFIVGDPGGSGGGGGTNHPNLVQYLGDTPVFLEITDALANTAEIEFEISYVELLPYSFNEVTFEYPSDYSLIQTDIIENFQNLNFSLFSDRTIENVEMFNNTGDITNDGNVATVTFIVFEATSINDILIVYELASDELGVIPFSTFLGGVVNECDEYGEGFFGLVIEPESNTNTEIIQKNFVLIIDSSGSMRDGDKMIQAKEAANFIVNNLNIGDYFNIIDFDNNINLFRPNLVENTIANRNAALAFIDQIIALGATNISDTLLAAINQYDGAALDKANIIVFFTDGGATQGVTDTGAILDLVEDAVDALETEIFLFTFGIGQDVTKDLLTLLAVENNGFVTFLGDDEIVDVISNFYLTIRNPVLLNTQITTTPPNVLNELYPEPFPNLYKGQQLVLAARYAVPETFSLTLTGTAFNEPVEYVYQLDLSTMNNAEFSFLPKLWAKKKIESLTIQYYSYPPESPEAMALLDIIEQTSICYQVLSPFTGLGDPLEIEEFLDASSTSLNFFPNPFTEQTSVIIDLKVPETILIHIYSIDGKLVKVIKVDGKYGPNRIEWNGENENGDALGAGIYLYTVKIGKENANSGKLIKL
jgi:Ca-activated chloride channel family protein